MVDGERIKKEKEYLELVKNEIQMEKDRIHIRLKEIPFDYKNRYSDVKWGDEDLVNDLTSSGYKRLTKLEGLQNNPYFGKIDFQKDGDAEKLSLYIGKTFLARSNGGNQLITDWRTPIASLYYDNSIGRASYTTSFGKISGELKLKSQILIKDGELVDIRDTDLVSDDELIAPYLDVSADSRMKNIIASIQKEQNEIIRKPLNSNLIVQGAAGSGKTSVALHRIAYLVYNESDKYSSDQFVVIGPNKYFLNYISSLLPELEADSVEQYTFTELTNNFIKNTIEVDGQSSSLINYLKKNQIDKTLKYKLSLNYKNDLDKFVKDYIMGYCEKNIEINGITIISSETIKSYLSNCIPPYKEKIENFIKKNIDQIKENSEKISDLIWDKYKLDIRKLEPNDPKIDEIYNEYRKLKIELQKGCGRTIRNYFNFLNIISLDLYKKFIQNIDKYCFNLDQIDLESLKQNYLFHSNKKIFYEDLPAIIYLNLQFNQFNLFDKKVHIVIDEAQDFGIFHFYILKKIFKNSSFSIFGDLAQSIYSYESIDNWESVQNEMLDSKCDIINLNKSYRTTVEIMDVANIISKKLQLAPANSVIRHGDNVKIINLNGSDKNKYIIDRINGLEKSCKSVALICKTEEEALKEYEMLKGSGIKSVCITSKDTEYNGGLCVLTSYLAKGLEFDAVIINDASEEIYKSNSQIDMKLLYVAITRPLHTLDIIYTNNMTLGLQETIPKEKIMVKKTI